MTAFRGKKKHAAFSGNHQRSWLWGHHAVCETITGGRWPVLQIYATRVAVERSREVIEAAELSGIPLEIVKGERLEELAHTQEHQGLLARLGPYPYLSLDDFELMVSTRLGALKNPAQGGTTSSNSSADTPLIVICDRIQDNHNFGAILRSCDGTNVLGVIVGTSHQSAMTPHVIRSSSGAANHVPVIQTEDLVAGVLRIRKMGFQILAADSGGTQTLWKTNLRPMTALILGSEANGVDPELLTICDQRVTIPMAGAVSSLNVAVAAGVLLYEIRRQQALV